MSYILSYQIFNLETIINADSMIRIGLAIIFVGLLTTGMSFRIRAARADGNPSRREEGSLLMVALRLFGFSAWGGLIAYLISPAVMAWSSMGLGSGPRWTGVGLAALGAELLTWMFRSLGANISDTVAIRDEHRLVTNGPYRWIRHPMYSFFLLFLAGISLAADSWFLAGTGLAAFVLLLTRTPIEERRLLESFGDEYRRYMGRTGRYLSRIRTSS